MKKVKLVGINARSISIFQSYVIFFLVCIRFTRCQRERKINPDVMLFLIFVFIFDFIVSTSVRNTGSKVKWILCSGETKFCSVSSLRTARFGVKDKWIRKVIQPPGVYCNSTEFGGDPYPSQQKLCEIALLEEENYKLVTPIKRNRKIYDAISFNGEWDMLEIRIKTLARVVDMFILVESNLTFSGRSKPMYLQDASWFLPSYKKQLRILSATLNATAKSWKNEDVTRDSVRSGLFDADANDWIIISDVDEIPRPELVSQLQIMDEVSVGFPCHSFYYNFRWGNGDFGKPVATRIGLFKGGSETWRKSSFSFPAASCWHCSYCFGPSREDFVDQFIRKVTSFSHTEYSGGKYIDPTYILKCFDNGISPFYGNQFSLQEELDLPPIVMKEKKFSYMLASDVFVKKRPKPFRGVLLDLGSQVGDTASPDIYEWPPFVLLPIVVHCFEGNPAFCDNLGEFTQKQPASFDYCPVVIGTVDANVTFYIDVKNERRGGSSLGIGHPDTDNGAVPISVPMIDIGRFLRESVSVDDYVIIKMDIEGEEHEILPKISYDPELIRLIDCIYCEIHHVRNGPKHISQEVTNFALERLEKFGVVVKKSNSKNL